MPTRILLKVTSCNPLVMQPCIEVQTLEIVTFVVECRGKKISLPMFVVPGGRKTCLNKASWQKLAPGVEVSQWGESIFLRGTIHGLPAKLHVGQDQSAGINVVGKDWLSQGKLMLVTDYNMDGCLLLVSDEITRSRFPEPFIEKFCMLLGWMLTCCASYSRQVAAAERISKLSLPGKVGLAQALKTNGPCSRPCLPPVALGHVGVSEITCRCLLTSVCFIAIIHG